MADDHVGEAWMQGWKAWLAGSLPPALAGFTVLESSEEGERPQKRVVVAMLRAERVPRMGGTARVHGVIALAEPFDGSTVEEHRARVAALWAVLKATAPKPGPLVGVYLHDVRWEDRESVVRDGDRVTGWPVSSMATRSESAGAEPLTFSGECLAFG